MSRKLFTLEHRQGGQPLLQPVHRITTVAKGIHHAIPQHHIIFHQQDPHSYSPLNDAAHQHEHAKSATTRIRIVILSETTLPTSMQAGGQS
jgi:hypothetical protein